MAQISKSEPRFIVALILVLLFLGINDTITKFFIPTFGEEIYRIINFYFMWIIALVALMLYLGQKADDITIFGFLINFTIFIIPLYVLLSWFFQGNVSSIPPIANHEIIKQTIVSVSENFMAFVLLPTIIPWGTGGSTILSKTIFSWRGHDFGYNIPDSNRIKQGLPGVFFVSFLHVGSYSTIYSTVPDFLSGIVIVTALFVIMWIFKLSFGFGASEGLHGAWNLSLTATRGVII